MLNSPPNSESSNGESIKCCCTVCAHPIARNNFGILSCNACAAFFRRTLIQNRKYMCQCSSLEDDSPTSGLTSLRECKSCRFQKCLQAGMNAKAIRSMEVWKWRQEMSSSKANSSNAGECKKRSKPVVKHENDVKMENLPMPEDWKEMQYMQNLLYAGDKINRIHHSRSEMPENLLQNYIHADDVVRTHENLLGNAEKFQNELPPRWNVSIGLASSDHVWKFKPDIYIRDLLSSVGFAKSLPIFNQLDFNDQRILLRSQTLSAVDLLICFFSFQMGAKVLIAPDQFPLIELFKLKKYQNDPTVFRLAQKVYCHSMKHMCNVAPAREEFAYLLALILINPAVNGLSIQAQQLLRTETEKLGRALLRWQQQNLGDAPGALRYSDTLRLVGQSMVNAQRHRELVVYLDLMHDRGRFEEVMPKALVPFSTMGPCELPQLSGSI